MVTEARNPTDRAKIVERLRRGAWNPEWAEYVPADDRDEAADLIEQDGQRIAALEAEIERLKEANQCTPT